MKKLNLFIVILLLFAPSVFASRPLSVTRILDLPLAERLVELRKQGDIAFSGLSKMAFDNKQNLESRWRAVTALGRAFPKKSQNILERALNQKEWYMRNAALLVLPYGSRKWAVQWARRMMHDQALVVRTAAVKALQQLGASEAQPLLWEKLYSRENFRGGDSLWIRTHILEALTQFAHTGEEYKFVAVLGDKDKSLHPIALRALKKLTRQDLATQSEWLVWLDQSRDRSTTSLKQ